MHTVTVGAGILNATTPQTIATSLAGGGAGHMHAVTLTAANLATLRGGGMVSVLSTLVATHTHTFTVSCT
jgi:hypothetical protein